MGAVRPAEVFAYLFGRVVRYLEGLEHALRRGYDKGAGR